MKRKIVAAVAAGVFALVLAAPAEARGDQGVKGKFKAKEYKALSEVRGAGRARTVEDGAPGEWRVGLTLQKVFRTDYEVWVDTFVDDGDKVVEADEKQGFVHAADCDLSTPSSKGHEGCVDESVMLVGVPYRIELRYTNDAGDEVVAAWAHVKG